MWLISKLYIPELAPTIKEESDEILAANDPPKTPPRYTNNTRQQPNSVSSGQAMVN
jgi:hypothetical protein